MITLVISIIALVVSIVVFAINLTIYIRGRPKKTPAPGRKVVTYAYCYVCDTITPRNYNRNCLEPNHERNVDVWVERNRPPDVPKPDTNPSVKTRI